MLFRHYRLLRIIFPIVIFGSVASAKNADWQNPAYSVNFSHDRDENEFRHYLNYRFKLGNRLALSTSQDHRERYNATLKRKETHLNLHWQMQRMIADSIWINLKLSGSRTIDDRLKSQFSSAYKSTTTRKSIASAFTYKPVTSLYMIAEIGYDSDHYDRTGETIRPWDTGSYLSGKVISELEWRDDFQTRLNLSTYRNFRDVREHIEHMLSGQANYYSRSGLPNLQWAFRQLYSSYNFPGGSGLERRKINDSDHQLTMTGAPFTDFSYHCSGHINFTGFDYDSVFNVISIDRKDYKKEIYDVAFEFFYRWNRQVSSELSFLWDRLERDYDLSNINDAVILRRKVSAQIRYNFSRKDTIRVAHVYDVVQHTYRDSNSHADRDVVNKNITAGWTHYFFNLLRFNLRVGLTETHLINISRFVSANNHRSTNYLMYPGFTYLSPGGLIIGQSLEMNANYIVYDFLTDDLINPNDRLIRRFSYRSLVVLPLGDKLRPEITYRYEPQDNGGYLYNPDRDKRLYQPNREKLTDVLSIRVKYQMLSFVSVEPYYIFQESRLWDLSDHGKNLVTNRKQKSLGLRVDYQSALVKMEAFASHVFRKDLPDYWHVECTMSVRF